MRCPEHACIACAEPVEVSLSKCRRVVQKGRRDVGGAAARIAARTLLFIQDGLLNLRRNAPFLRLATNLAHYNLKRPFRSSDLAKFEAEHGVHLSLFRFVSCLIGLSCFTANTNLYHLCFHVMPHFDFNLQLNLQETIQIYPYDQGSTRQIPSQLILVAH